jgi:hypothetical protein
MEPASQQRVCVAKQAPFESGRFTFNGAHTKLAGTPPTVDDAARFGRFGPLSTAVRVSRGGHHPLAAGDGHRP